MSRQLKSQMIVSDGDCLRVLSANHAVFKSYSIVKCMILQICKDNCALKKVV